MNARPNSYNPADAMRCYWSAKRRSCICSANWLENKPDLIVLPNVTMEAACQ